MLQIQEGAIVVTTVMISTNKNEGQKDMTVEVETRQGNATFFDYFKNEDEKINGDFCRQKSRDYCL